MLDEKRRHDMIDSFIETNGKETAMALAESLFSNDHATKDDLQAVKADVLAVKADVVAVKADIKDLDAKMVSHYRWLMSLMITLFTIAFSLRIFG